MIAVTIPRDAIRALCAELRVYEQNGVPIVNSRDVAVQFNKEHRNVLRDLDGIRHSSDLSGGISGWFREILIEHPTVPGRMDRSVDMTRDGFMLLVFGWTGLKAMPVKIRHTHAFNRMHEFIRTRIRRMTRAILSASEAGFI
jgi:Rha family phage regulatory protein